MQYTHNHINLYKRVCRAGIEQTSLLSMSALCSHDTFAFLHPQITSLQPNPLHSCSLHELQRSRRSLIIQPLRVPSWLKVTGAKRNFPFPFRPCPTIYSYLTSCGWALSTEQAYMIRACEGRRLKPIKQKTHTYSILLRIITSSFEMMSSLLL